MHEFGIAEALLRSVIEEADGQAYKVQRVRRVRVAVGRLLSVSPESLSQAYEGLAEGTVAEGSRLDLRIVPVTARCRRCEWEGEVEPPFFACASCGGGGLEVKTGRELRLEELEVDDHDDNDRSRVQGSEGRKQ